MKNGLLGAIFGIVVGYVVAVSFRVSSRDLQNIENAIRDGNISLHYIAKNLSQTKDGE